MQDYQTFGVITLVALFPLGFLLAFVCGIWAKRKHGNTIIRRVQGVGILLMGASILIFAVTDICAIHASERITVQGNLERLRQTHGKGHTSYFYVVGTQWSPQLSTDYSGPTLQNGEPVRATYLSNTTTVTDLQTLYGSRAGWKLHEGNGTATSVVLICISTLFLVAGIATYRASTKSGS